MPYKQVTRDGKRSKLRRKGSHAQPSASPSRTGVLSGDIHFYPVLVASEGGR